MRNRYRSCSRTPRACCPSSKVKLDETVVRNRIKKLQTDVNKALSKVGVNMHTGVAENELRKLRSEAARLFSDLDVDFDSEKLDNFLKEFEGKKLKVEFDADPSRELGTLFGMFGPGRIPSWTVDVDAETDTATKEVDKLIAATERKLARLTTKRDLGIEVDLEDVTKTELELALLTRKRKVQVETDIDLDLIQREMAEISSTLAQGAAKTAGEVITDSVGFLGEQLGAVTRLNPILAAGAITAIVATIGDLTGVVAQLSGGLALLPAFGFAAAAGIGAVALATDGFGDAIKNMGDPDKFAVALRELAPNAQQAALSIQAVKPAFDALKGSLSQALFENVGPQIINTVNAILPAITPGLTAIAGAFNTMFQQVATIFQDPVMLQTIQTMLSNIAGAFQALAPAVGPFITALTQIGAVGASFLPGIFQGLTNAAQTFANVVAQATADGSLQEFIQKAIDAFGQLMPLLPALVESFMKLAPLGEAILPGLVHSLELLLAVLPAFFYSLSTMGPTFIMTEGLVRAAATAFDFLGGIMASVGGIIDLLMGKPTALANAFATAFPGISGIVANVGGAVRSTLSAIGDAIDWVISKLNFFITLANNLPFVDINLPNIPSLPGNTDTGPGRGGGSLATPGKPNFPTRA